MHQTDYIITGPTASGKSDFAHCLAHAVGGVIINCDSVQIYRGIENISASPFANRDVTPDIDGVPYRLFSILDLSAQISVADYLDMARDEYNAAHASGHPAIFVGGTGYYVNALLAGISPMPDVGAAARTRARDLVGRDIDAARKLLPPEFRATDPQRISRALEVFFETGRHLIEWQRAPRVGAVVPNARRILINPPADVLRTRAARRIPEMVRGGAVAEAERIIAANWDPRRAIGAAQLCAYLRGEITRDACEHDWINKTNQYAKRQRTWFRTQFNADVKIGHIPTADDVDLVL